MTKDRIFTLIGSLILLISLLFIGVSVADNGSSWISVAFLAVAGISVLGAGALLRNSSMRDDG